MSKRTDADLRVYWQREAYVEERSVLIWLARLVGVRVDPLEVETFAESLADNTA